MRFTRIVLLSALGMVTGCGGCDSCFGTAQPGDDAGATMTGPTPRPLATAADAGPATDDRDGGREAGSDAAPDPVPRASGVPRPKAPMPLGEFQVCGVYDGPRCEKKCLKGACRQECDGVECELTCSGGYCSQLCGAGGKCKMTCNGGHCVQVCTNTELCDKQCAGGACE